ncbi:Uncharacterized protein APZ42_030869 [Daphnia magna]|uniref:Uncharacterized protein n=1 Tax=Daphnia magna TaxID=35525 RepID=A0A164NDF9_9CRUS|nr:Uncharacterized protein APZ42_030869 [Daphnia magna]
MLTTGYRNTWTPKNSEIPSSKVKTIADMCVTLDIWYNAKSVFEEVTKFGKVQIIIMVESLTGMTIVDKGGQRVQVNCGATENDPTADKTTVTCRRFLLFRKC